MRALSSTMLLGIGGDWPFTREAASVSQPTGEQRPPPVALRPDTRSGALLHPVARLEAPGYSIQLRYVFLWYNIEVPNRNILCVVRAI